LDFVMSIGLTMKNEAMYSTFPFALRLASVRSVISEFWKSCGSSSPKARPVIVSYCPALPKLGHAWLGGVPVQNAGDTFKSTTTRVTRASACMGTANAAATAAAASVKRYGMVFISSLFPSGSVNRRGHRDRGGDGHGRAAWAR